MPKELFNQPLIVSPNEPEDTDRVALGTPSSSGGKNITWARLKQLLGGSGGIPEAPIDGKQYARKDADWSEVISGTADIATNADMDAGTNDTKAVSPLKFVYGITTRVFSGLATVNKTIQGAINWLQNLTILLKEPTGFRYPDQVIVTYDGTTRTITLTGNPEAYYRGNQIAALVNGWVSEPHAVGDGTYFLYFDGTNFVWSNTPWSFDVVMIAMAYRDGANFCLRECHGLMQWQTHQELHETLGTYLFSGGDIGAIVLNSNTAADRRPTLTAALIKDEDLPTSLPSLAAGAYSQLYLSGANTANLIADQADILPLSTNQPFYNQFTGGAWQQTLFPVNAYGKVFIMAVPVTADVECQKRRFVFIQPQTVSTTLSDIQNITIASVNLGHIATALAEYVFIGEIIVRYTAGNWVVVSTAKLTGTRVLQGQIFGGGGGGTVLSANVTLSTPLLGATNQDEYNMVNETDKARFDKYLPEMAFSDEKTAFTVSTTVPAFSKHIFDPFIFDKVDVGVNAAPTDSTAVFDVHKNGVSVFSAYPSIDSGERTTLTAAVPSALTSPTITFAAGDFMEVYIRQIGATIAGAGGKLRFKGKLL
jgi:hypothetical protein